MTSLFWVLISGLFLFILSGLALSFFLTHRFHLTEVHSPAEFGLAFEEIAFPAADGLQLRGVYIPAADPHRAVIILHGHGGSMDLDIQRAPYFHQAGFNVMLFDFRAHGRSQGKVASFGFLERQDVLGAVSFLKERGVKRIGLLGFSYGGMAAMLAAPLCTDIAALVSDGGPARLRSAIAGRAGELHLPRLLGRFFGWQAVAFTSLRLGVNLFAYEPIRWVGRIAPRPLFFIHGELDRYLFDFDELFAAAGDPKEAWRLPGVDHTRAGEAQPEEFYRRVIAFFEKHL